MLDSILWLVVLATGLFVAVRSSRWALGHLTSFASSTRIPQFLIGITLVSFGTDLPEIANSVVSSISGHGDINIGDSVGSATVQSTLVLGILPLVGGAFPLRRGRIVRVGAVSVVSLVIGALLMLDGDVTRLDAGILLVCWLAGTAIVWRGVPGTETEPHVATPRRPAVHLALASLGLLVVGAGATTAVEAITSLAEVWSAPEYLVAFFLASIGTSLPELVFGIAAVRQKKWDLAVGDALGSSFLDSTLSIGVGPLLVPITVTTRTAVLGSLTAAAILGLAVAVLAWRGRHTRLTGVSLLALFVVAYGVITFS